jgi:hypothetical protein
MSRNSKFIAALCGSASAIALFAPGALAAGLPAVTSLCGATAPATVTPPPDVKCINVIQLPGAKLNSFDISWANPFRAEYYLADRSNAGIDIISTSNLKFLRRLTGFAGIVLKSPTAINNNVSGPNGVVSHNRWLYAGDGDSTLKVFDLKSAAATAVQVLSTGGTTRVDEMDITPDGVTLLAANNAEDPPFGTQFIANGDSATSGVTPAIQWSVDTAIMPTGFGLSLEQPRWDPNICGFNSGTGTTTCGRFVVGIPIIDSHFFPNSANNAPTPICNYGQLAGAITCDGGLLVIDPTNTTDNTVPPDPALDTPPFPAFQVALTGWDPVSATGVIPLTHFTFPSTPPAGTFYNGCGPNGVAYNPVQGILGMACTPGNNPSNVITGAVTDGSGVGGGLPDPLAPPTDTSLTFQFNNFPSPGVTGGDELWFNFASCAYPTIPFPTPGGTTCTNSQGPVLYGDQRFYVAASKNNTYKDTLNGFPTGTSTGAPTNGPVLGILGGALKFDVALGFEALPLIGTIPVSSGSHSVAADAIRNLIFSPQVAPACKTAGCNTNIPSNLNVIGGDTTGNRATTSNSRLICGTVNGCIAVYRSTPGNSGTPNSN